MAIRAKEKKKKSRQAKDLESQPLLSRVRYLKIKKLNDEAVKWRFSRCSI